jgi:hypothetical protein
MIRDLSPSARRRVRFRPVRLTVVDQTSTNKDTVVAIVGASAALAGLVLVFLGILVTSFQSLLGNVRVTTLDRFKKATWMSLAVFVLALASMVLGVTWLVADGGHGFYLVIVVAFFVQVGALAVVAAYVTTRVLLGG